MTYSEKDCALRSLLLIFICFFGLSGCVNYYGMRQQSVALNEASLARPVTYHLPVKKIVAQGWWGKFHDSQLNQLMDIALADSPTMQTAQSRVRKAQQVTDESIATLWPSIDASGSLQRERFSKFGLAPPPFNGKTFNIAEVGLNLNYEFDIWGKNRQLIATNVSEECAAEADLAQAKLILSAAVAATYFQLQHDIEQWHIAREIQHHQQEIYNIVQKRAQHGVDSDIPLTVAQSNLEAARIVAAQWEANKKLTGDQLAVLIGKNPMTTSIDTSRYSYTAHQVHLPAYLPANILAQRPDIHASLLRAEAAAHQVNAAKARFYPNFNLNILFSYQSLVTGQLFNPQSQNNAIGGAFDLPIFDAGARRANLGGKYAEYDLAVNDYNQSVLTALREVADQVANLKALRSQLRAQQFSYLATQQKYHLMSSQYHHGIVEYTQVLNSKNGFLQQHAAQVDLQTKHLQTVVAMIKALGGKE